MVTFGSGSQGGTPPLGLDTAGEPQYTLDQLRNAAKELGVSLEFLCERIGVRAQSLGNEVDEPQNTHSPRSPLLSTLIASSEVWTQPDPADPLQNNIFSEAWDPTGEWDVSAGETSYQEFNRDNRSSPLHTASQDIDTLRTTDSWSVSRVIELGEDDEMLTNEAITQHWADAGVGSHSRVDFQSPGVETSSRAPGASPLASQPCLPVPMSTQLSSSGSSWVSINSTSSGVSSWVVTTPIHDADAPKAASDFENDFAVTPEEEVEFRAMSPILGPCSKVWVVPPRTRKSRKRKNLVEVNKRPRAMNETTQDNRQRRGPFKDDNMRQKTALTRRLKGCIRCRMQRIRCDLNVHNPQGPCLTCLRISGPVLCKLPCLRWIITDSSSYREQDRPYQLFSRRWQNMDLVDITNWASDSIETIQLSQIFIEAPYTVQVREFIPLEGDKLHESWPSGAIMKHHALPRYALADMNATAEMFEKWIDRNVYNYINATLDKADQLLWDTYLFAFKHIGKAKTSREQTLLADCFRFWVGCRKTSHPEHIFGQNKLGGQLVDDPQSPFYNVIPMPVIIIAQMECIMYTKVLRPKSQTVMKLLTELIMENKREYWLTIYLTLFILLHSCSLITKRDYETARQYNMRSNYANPESIKKHHSGILTMLAHFHYLNKGVHPFHLVYNEAGVRELARAAELNSNEVEFVRKTSRMIQEENRANLMREIRANSNFGHPLYWVSQLYDVDWTPGTTA